MRTHRVLSISILVLTALALGALPAFAQEPPPPAQPQAPDAVSVTDTADSSQQQGQPLTAVDLNSNAEVSFFLGGLVGGDLLNVLSGDFSLGSTLENGRTYGGRVGYYTFPFGVEGSFTYSNSGLAFDAALEDFSISLGARVMYAEVNALLIIIPGPIQPFVTGGGGLHSYELRDLPGVGFSKWGWNFGGGVKANIKRVSLRVDVRDHLTTVSAGDLNLAPDAAELLNFGDQDLHNVEISFGIGFRF